MAQPVIQTSFNAGEWAPALNARVDLAKYHSGASLLRNFFVDYRGGATTRPGTKYILQAKSNGVVRLIPFQASFSVTYMLEFGQNYIRFYNNGAPVLENATTISGATQANPGVITDTAHGYSNGDWVFIQNVGGMTQLNGNYYIIAGATTNTYTLTDLNGNAINTTTFGAYTSGGTAQRVYTITSPYQASDLNLLKFCQDVNTLIICNGNYVPYQLVLNTATNWVLSAINFGSTISAPTTITASSSLGGGSVNYAYVVTSVDATGQESGPSSYVTLASLADLRTTAGTNSLAITAVSGAVGYNVYKANPRYGSAVPAGSIFGYIGYCTGLVFIDSNIGPDFTSTPPIPTNPFLGAGVATVNLTSHGAGYNSVPTVTISASSGATATAVVTLEADTIALASPPGNQPASVGQKIYFPYGIVAIVATTSFQITSYQPFTYPGTSRGSISSGSVPSGNVTDLSNTYDCTLTWRVASVQLTYPGTGYTSAPSVAFSGGSPSSAATATTTLAPTTAGNPAVPAFIQQRLFLGAPPTAPSQYNLSVPGFAYNFNITNPIQPDNAIQETLTNTVLNTIKSAVSVSAGLVIITDKGAWLLNGGSAGSAISATAIVANPQAYSGGSDVPPIVTPNDILYVQAKGSIVRDLSYNFYLNNYVGADISVLSSHLFYGYTISQWCFAEEPFKTVWAVRSDGKLLSLAFVKEQELLAWAHHDTNGTYISIASIVESVSFGNVDAVYTVVQRVVNGNTVNYIERFAELYYPQGYKSAWQVDAGIQYNGSPATSFSGATHLANMPVVGLADGIPFSTTMSATGTFTLGTAASLVTVGLAFTPQLGTLALDLGEPTSQGKRKSVSAVNIRVNQTLGLTSGKKANFSDQIVMKDLVLGNVGTQSNAVVTDLVTSDARIILPPQYDVFGQYYFQQSLPYPASILGVMPEVTVGDTPR